MRATCPACAGRGIPVRDKLSWRAGQTIRCADCGAEFELAMSCGAFALLLVVGATAFMAVMLSLGAGLWTVLPRPLAGALALAGAALACYGLTLFILTFWPLRRRAGA